MKRDLDLIRELLQKVEDDPQLDGYHSAVFDSSDFPEHTDDEVAYHVDLLIEADMLKGESRPSDAPSTPVTRLSWQGHEFLSSISDPGIWEKTKERVRGLSGVALAVVGAIAQAETMKYLGLTKT